MELIQGGMRACSLSCIKGCHLKSLNVDVNSTSFWFYFAFRMKRNVVVLLVILTKMGQALG